MNDVRPIGVLVVLRCRPDAAPPGAPAEVLGRALAQGGPHEGLEPPVIEAAPDDVDAVLRLALGYSGPAPALEAGKHATLESTASGWRLVALGVRDPLHGLGGDEGIGPPATHESP